MKSTIKNVGITIVTLLSLSSKASLVKITQEMNAFQKPQAESLRNTLETDPEFSRDFKTYLDKIKSLKSIGNSAERFKKSVEINISYKDLFTKAMKKSKVNPVATKNFARMLEKKYLKKGTKFHIMLGEFLTYQAWVETTEEQEPPPQETEFSFTAPFDFEHSSMEGNGYKNVNLNNGSIYLVAESAIMDSHKNKGGLGLFLNIPNTIRKVRVSARLPETNIYVAAYAGPGGSGATASSVIDVVSPDEECVKTQEHISVVAPVIWFTSRTMLDTTVIGCNITVPRGSQDIAVRFQAVGEATAGGAAFAHAQLESKPDVIKVVLVE